MSREMNRQNRSNVRSEEYRRKRRKDQQILAGVILLYVGIPFLWNVAVEFGWVHPIQTEGLKDSILEIGLVLAVILYIYVNKYLDYRQRDKEDPETPEPLKEVA